MLILELCLEFFFSTSRAVELAFRIGFPFLFPDQGGLVFLLSNMKKYVSFFMSPRHIYNVSKEKLQKELQQCHTRVHRGYTKGVPNKRWKKSTYHSKPTSSLTRSTKSIIGIDVSSLECQDNPKTAHKRGLSD